MSTQATSLATSDATGRASVGSMSDFIALTKPRVTFTVLLTAVAGFFFAPRSVFIPPAETQGKLLWLVLGMSLIVGGANALNMFIERESDRAMTRTASRPLPAGRMAPWAAALFGVTLSAAAVPVLVLGVNIPTGILGALANLLYVGFYTPLKQKSWLALLVGAVPGAMPPLMGWSAATGEIDRVGLALFAILFVWQIPHFHAISLFRKEEYRRAGLVVYPLVAGDRSTRVQIVSWTALLFAVSLLPFWVGATSLLYPAIASVLGVAFFALAVQGLRTASMERWARSFFGLSIPYLLALFALLLATKISPAFVG